MLAVPVQVEKTALSRDVEGVAEPSALQKVVVLLGIGEGRVHTLAQLVP